MNRLRLSVPVFIGGQGMTLGVMRRVMRELIGIRPKRRSDRHTEHLSKRRGILEQNSREGGRGGAEKRRQKRYPGCKAERHGMAHYRCLSNPIVLLRRTKVSLSCCGLVFTALRHFQQTVIHTENDHPAFCWCCAQGDAVHGDAAAIPGACRTLAASLSSSHPPGSSAGCTAPSPCSRDSHP